MEKQKFDFDTSYLVESTVIQIGSYVLLVLLIINGCLYFFAKHNLSIIILISSVVALLFCCSIVLYSFIRYRSQPIVINKHEVLEDKREVQKNINTYNKKIAQTQQNRELITKEEQRELDVRKKNNQEIIASYENQISQSKVNEENKIAETLANVQREYYSSGMRNTLISQSKIPGVGPGLTKRLESHGIFSAQAVSYKKVIQINGFGENKTNSMVAWRRSVENELRRTSPQRLPRDEEIRIRQSYESQRTSLKENIKLEEKSYRIDLEDIQNRAKQEHNQNDKDEEVAQERLRNYQYDKEIVLEVLSDYTDINFR